MDNRFKNNNNLGFTLVELMAVIIVLGVISVIVIPSAMKMVNDNSLKIYKIKEKEIMNATKDYAKYSKDFVAPTSSEARYVTIEKLVSGNYINKILDNKSGNECNAFAKITLNNIHGYDYEVCLICDEYTTNKPLCSTINYEEL